LTESIRKRRARTRFVCPVTHRHNNCERSLRHLRHEKQRNPGNYRHSYDNFSETCDVLTSAAESRPPVVHWACCSTCVSAVDGPATVTGTASLNRRQQRRDTSSIVVYNTNVVGSKHRLRHRRRECHNNCRSTLKRISSQFVV